jgi:hypothetical protein
VTASGTDESNTGIGHGQPGLAAAMAGVFFAFQ